MTLSLAWNNPAWLPDKLADSASQKFLEVVKGAVKKFQAIIEEATRSGIPTGPKELLDLERHLHQVISRECIDPVVGAIIQRAHEDPSVLDKTELLVQSTPGLKPQRATETIKITLLGGSTLSLKTPYYLKRGPRKRRGRRRKGRGKEGNGVYPILAAIGIHFRVTPALAEEVARQMTMCTVQETKEILAIRGINLDGKQIKRLTLKLAQRGLSYREWCMKQVRGGHRGEGLLRGKRLVIGVDGGRLRTRVSKEKGRKCKSGRNSYDAPWREPKVFVVYEIDDKGKKRHHGVVRYDATLRDADGVFEILAALLQEIGAHEAAAWAIVGDGADWIWDRVEDLIKAVGYDKSRVTQVVDYYHAVQRLYVVANEVKWDKKDYKKWIKLMKGHLKRGEIELMLKEAEELYHGRNAKSIRKLMGYFEEHKERMRYSKFKKAHIPMGSGAVESCVRRVVNLRLKGNGIFWKPENAEGMLFLRSQLLCGRWSDLIPAILESESLWSLKNPESIELKEVA